MPDQVRPPRLSLEDAVAFLHQRHGGGVSAVELLPGGYWSTAFGFVHEGRRLVARFGPIKEGFEADLAASALARPGLPIPEVLEVGDALGRAYALSVRADGAPLEDVRPDQAPTAGPMLGRLLAALRAVEPGPWPVRPGSWREHVRSRFVDDPAARTAGWRARMGADPTAERAFLALERRADELLDACPERDDLVHGDLLYGNVLVTPDADDVTAVISWKCAAGRGDHLFDVAWCTLWGDVAHPGIAAADPWGQVVAMADPGSMVDAAARHHLYEVAIAGGHLGWYVATDEPGWLRRLAAHAEVLLERGPLSA